MFGGDCSHRLQQEFAGELCENGGSTVHGSCTEASGSSVKTKTATAQDRVLEFGVLSLKDTDAELVSRF